jgi:hypothetical protein
MLNSMEILVLLELQEEVTEDYLPLPRIPPPCHMAENHVKGE